MGTEETLERLPRPALSGARQVFTLPAIVLFWSAFGYGAFAQAAGLDWFLTGISTPVIWALPGQVVLVDQIAHGASLFTTAIAVTLTAVRLLPLTVSLMPVLRSERMPVWLQLISAHMVAVTVWVMAMTALPKVPRDQRPRFYLGLAIGMVIMSTVGTVAGHQAAAVLPAAIAGGLLFLTPLYFLFSMSKTARELSDRSAVVIGLVLGPVFHIFSPELDLALTGFVGGSLAYFGERLIRR